MYLAGGGGVCGSRESGLHILFSVHRLHAGRENSSCTISALILGIFLVVSSSEFRRIGNWGFFGRQNKLIWGS